MRCRLCEARGETMNIEATLEATFEATIGADTRHPRDLLRIRDLHLLELEHLLDLAGRMKEAPAGWVGEHPGQTVACYFAKPSTRTRVSFEGAAWRLGMLPIMLRPDELQLGRGEPLSDTARVLAGYAAAIVIRTFSQADIEQMAANASVPVINALSDDHHPCQALADLLTLREHFGSLDWLKLAYVGDGNNVANSLMEAGALAGMTVSIAAPPGYHPDEDVVAEARALAAVHGGAIEVFDDARAAVRGADAVYTDVWVSMGDEAEQAERLERLARYRVDEELMSRAAPHAVFMHCLPAHRGQEVAASVIDGPQSIVFEQARNRLPTEQALLHTLVSGCWDGS
jgi:ornithine carbamoyltransferase